MKYINTSLPNFDAVEGQWDYSGGEMKSLGDGTAIGIVNISADKVFVKLDWESFSSYRVSGSLLGVYLENNNYVNVYYDGSYDNLSIRVNNNALSQKYDYSTSKAWIHIFLIVDTVEGTVDFYCDKCFKERITNDKIKGSKVSCCKFYSRREGSYYSSLRSLIVSDERVSLNETLYELPLNMISNTFEMDENGALVGTSAGQKVVYKADITEIEKRFRPQLATLVIPEAQASTDVNSVKINLAGEETTEALLENGGCLYVDRIVSTNEDLAKDISIETV